jgi:3-oxoacyl-[acyl-carrier protein] reductase
MNSVILITGTSKGIGEYLANYYLGKDNIVVGCSRRASNIDNKNYYHFKLDVTDEKEVIKMVRKVYKDLRKIDVLINNAGIALMNHLIFTPLNKAEDIFKTNFLGTFLLTREVVKIMTKKKFGRIVNFSSIAVPLSIEGEAVYASSKAAIETFTKISAREVSEFNITVNAVAPTPIKTDLIRTLPKEKITKLVNQQAIKRLGTFKDVSNVVDFFIKEESDFITGQIVYLGGV